MNSIWWQQITKPRRFLEDISESVLSEKSVIISNFKYVPWVEEFKNNIEFILNRENSERRFVCIDCPRENVGDYLVNKYCKEEKRNTYRYGMSHAEFLAKSDDVVMNSYYLWVENVTADKFAEWSKFIAEYSKSSPKNSQRAVFILQCNEDLSNKAVKGAVNINYSNYADNYDLFVYCTLASSNANIESCLKPYLAETAALSCMGDIELADKCIDRGLDFLQNPSDVLKEIKEYELKSDYTSFEVEEVLKNLNSNIWESQLKLIFPKIQQYRTSFIKKYYHDIAINLPIKNAFDEEIETPEDAELGLLWSMIGMGYLKVSSNDYYELQIYKNARNSLAHLNSISLDDVKSVMQDINYSYI